MKAVLAALVIFTFSPAVFAQDFVAQCTEDHVQGEEILCQTNGVWGTCFEENGSPECGVAYCPSSAVQGDSCVVAGEPGGCIPICEVDFDIQCGAGPDDLVCEVGSTGMFDDGEDIQCATGTGATLPSLLLMLALFGIRRRRP